MSRHTCALSVTPRQLLRALQCASVGNLHVKNTLKDAGGALSLGASPAMRRQFITPLWAVARAWLAIAGDGLETFRAALFVGPALPVYADALQGATAPSPALVQVSAGAPRPLGNEIRGGGAAAQGSCTSTRAGVGAAAPLRCEQPLGVERWLPFLQRVAAARYARAPSSALCGRRSGDG